MDKELEEKIGEKFNNYLEQGEDIELTVEEAIYIEKTNAEERYVDEIVEASLRTLVDALEKSIPKQVVEKEMQKLKNMKVSGEVFTTSVNFAIKILEKLLEGK